MAQRWTLALIIICLPILATLITAFRVRDLPKTIHDSVKKPQKCDDCEVKVGQNLQSAKIDSDKLSFVDLKKSVRDKDQVVSKKPDISLSNKYEPKSVEEKGDDHLEFLKSRTGFRQETPLPSKLDKLFSIKQEAKKPWASHDDYDSEFDVKRDDDEDADYEAADYEDDDIQIPEILRKAKKELKKKDLLDYESSSESLEIKKKSSPDLDSSLENSDVKKKININWDSSSESLGIKKSESKLIMTAQREEHSIKTAKIDNIESKIKVREPKRKLDEENVKNEEITKKSIFKLELDDDDDDDGDDDDDNNTKAKKYQQKKKEDAKIKKLTSPDLDSSFESSEVKKKNSIHLDSSSESLGIKKSEPKSTINVRKEEYSIKTSNINNIESKIKVTEPKRKLDEANVKKEEITKKSIFTLELDNGDDDDGDDDDNDKRQTTKYKEKKKEVPKIKKSTSNIKSESKTKPELSSLETRINDMLKVIPYFNDDDDDSGDDDDDDDDDDDNDDDDDEVEDLVKKKDKSIERQSILTKKMDKEESESKESSEKISTKETIKLKHAKIDTKAQQRSQEDKNSVDKSNLKNKGLKSSPTESKVKKSIQTSSKEMKKIFKDYDDYEDDDDNDEEEDSSKSTPPPKVLVKKPIERHEKKESKSANKKAESKSKETESKKCETLKKEAKTDDGKIIKSDKPVETEKMKPKQEDKEDSKVTDKKLKKETPKISDMDSSKEKKYYQKDKLETEKDDKKDTSQSKIKEDKVRDTFKSPEFKKSKIGLDSKREKKDYGQWDKTSKEKLFDIQEASTSSESHLKPVTDALHRRNLLKSEFEDFYAFLPTFAPNFSRIHNPECRRHGQIVLRQLRGTKLWALNMLDATAKIPSGLLQGNGIQLGDFDQCLSSRARVQLDTGSVVKVQGKYCLARIDVKAEHPELEIPVHLAQAKNLIRSRIDDPGHFVPRFSTLSWGVCVPAVCTHEDVEFVLRDAIRHYQKTSGVAVRIKVDEDDCHVETLADWWKDWLETPTIVTLSFYGVTILLVVVATVQDFVAKGNPEEIQNENDSNEKPKYGPKEKKDAKDPEKSSDSIIGPFSLYRTIKKLFAPGTSDEIACIHGVRGISTLALLVAHKFLPVAAIPYTNRVYITEVVSAPIWSWCRAGWVFTDCFLLLSGALTAYRICKDSDTIAPKRLLSRYLRLTPALLAVVLFYAYIWDKISIGPMWGSLVTKNAEVCQEGWWWNMLYVQNYFGLEEMCAPQTHQLALDMQLTILGGVIVWAAQQRGFFRLVIPGLHAIAAYSRYTTVRDHRLTLLAYHGVSVSQLYRTARLSYTSTLHRSTPYLVGLSLGLELAKPTRHGKIFLTFGWFLSSMLWSLVWWAGMDSGSIQYRYNNTYAAQYATLAPIAAAVAIAWVIYAVNNGTCGFLSRLLCCRPLVFISRLSYALYLCQFIVFITNAATVKTSSEFTLMSLIDIQEIATILLSSIVLTLTLVIPLQSLHKVLSFSTKSEATHVANEPKNDAKKPEEEIKMTAKETPPARQRQHLMVHREVVQEIPQSEVEFEAQRKRREALEEILEEEEDGEEMEEESHMHDDDLEIIDEEEGGEESWQERGYGTGRSYSGEDDHDLDEWEWTANGRNGAQFYRYTR